MVCAYCLHPRAGTRTDGGGQRVPPTPHVAGNVASDQNATVAENTAVAPEIEVLFGDLAKSFCERNPLPR